MEREIRVSPDGFMVAIRGDNPPEAWNAWMVSHAIHGGHWASTAELNGWSTVTQIEAPPAEPTVSETPPA